jgi:hypothetical protein
LYFLFALSLNFYSQDIKFKNKKMTEKLKGDFKFEVAGR